ncbi:phosphoadenosine phosphosulfate reductase [Hymenobacter luteus]|uniref:Adenosine 5'-phosphosulfate reductase n=2 Tax=Hymenobacter TaxID=89966 RepID=A0A7W9SYU2_9BACT|nr:MULTISPECIES: phosphoadenylyl-sulfate reductase [Hymenobacter]MBB4601356.1 phosphoadenosine phosphosulfate reductase [Hymenobacter latericoloratus]MBB6058437.1 phosphoadenosine phosphosulfate reductase [Hymenobacter luteus]
MSAATAAPAVRALLDDLRPRLIQATALERLRLVAEFFPEQAVFSTSFGLEDQIISHLIFSHQLPIQVFTLDTGRNFQETYATWNKTLLKYEQPIAVYYPQRESVEQLMLAKGPNSFYESVENRKECCHIRKVEPLNRALAGRAAWVTGIRAEQSQNRQTMDPVEWDAAHNLVKVHPLFDWTWDQAVAFTQENGVPVNPLHQQGFVSIGCAPCTRAIRPGEDFRAGRWWWEDLSAKECGLHATAHHNGPDPVVEPVTSPLSS